MEPACTSIPEGETRSVPRPAAAAPTARTSSSVHLGRAARRIDGRVSCPPGPQRAGRAGRPPRTALRVPSAHCPAMPGQQRPRPALGPGPSLGRNRPCPRGLGPGKHQKLLQHPILFVMGPLSGNSCFLVCPAWDGAVVPRSPSTRNLRFCSALCLVWPRGPLRAAQGHDPQETGELPHARRGSPWPPPALHPSPGGGQSKGLGHGLGHGTARWRGPGGRPCWGSGPQPACHPG